jgi:hypothetical protein
MKKTIPALLMISLILVTTSVMSLSVNGIKSNLNIVTCNNSDKPDFIIKTLDWVKCRCPYGYIIRIRITNIGAEIEDTVVKVKVTLDSDKGIILFHYTEGVGTSNLNTTHLEIDFFKSTHIVTAEVDPHNSIEEDPDGGEDNNIMTKSFTKTKSKEIQGLSFQYFLDLFPNMFSILRHLLIV